jgi:hypothetical protein
MHGSDITKIEAMIYTIRGQRVMIDSDLAQLYGVETKALNRQVQRNTLRYPPLVFTEAGVAMLSSVLTSDRAALVNVSLTG